MTFALKEQNCKFREARKILFNFNEKHFIYQYLALSKYRGYMLLQFI